MEIFELRYFLGVARRQNVHKAALDLHVSPGSLSKAIGRLEGELGVPLFDRDGRNIRLTDYGRSLMARATEILQIEESARIELQGGRGAVHAVIAGAEVVLLRFGLAVADAVQKRFPQATFELQATTEAQALARVIDGTAHLAVVASDVPQGLTAKVLGVSHFRTVVGPRHPLAARAKSGKTVPIKDVLACPFACPSLPLFGQVNPHQSSDGWRDDQFPRKVGFVTPSLRMLEELVLSGRAVAYFPDYHVEALKVFALKLSGCPYACEQDIRLVTRDPKQLSWVQWLF